MDAVLCDAEFLIAHPNGFMGLFPSLPRFVNIPLGSELLEKSKGAPGFVFCLADANASVDVRSILAFVDSRHSCSKLTSR